MSARTASGSRGQALLEFALVIPLIMLLLMGLFDFGRGIYAYNTLSNAARDGARKAIVDQRVVAGVSVAAQEAADQATALGLDPTDASEVLVEYRTPDLSADCPASLPEWTGCVAVVTVNWQFQAITPIIGNFIGPITLSSTTKLPVEATNR